MRTYPLSSDLSYTEGVGGGGGAGVLWTESGVSGGGGAQLGVSGCAQWNEGVSGGGGGGVADAKLEGDW